MIPIHWTQHALTVNGARLHCYRTGDSSKPSIVLAHGFSDSDLCWLQTARDLKADYDIIMPDAHIPGTGHHVRFEYYAAYMKTVRTFLQAVA